jgi:hypothetical protein
MDVAPLGGATVPNVCSVGKKGRAGLRRYFVLNRNSSETAEVVQNVRELVGEHSRRRVLFQVVQECRQHDRFSPMSDTARPVREREPCSDFTNHIDTDRPESSVCDGSVPGPGPETAADRRAKVSA